MTTIGILGGGQLGRMLADAAAPLGLRALCYETYPDCSASHRSEIFVGEFSDSKSLAAFARQVDFVTYETENLPLDAAQTVAEICPLYPGLDSLKTTQDRLFEKMLFTELDIPTNQYRAINSLEELHRHSQALGYPCVLKVRRTGYDGKGQAIIRSIDDVAQTWNQLKGQDLLLETFVNFDKECSILAVRDRAGVMAFYPLTENTHRNGILRFSQAPFNAPHLTDTLQHAATKVLEKLNHVGMLAIEFFVQGDNVIANEIAPRVHNSGHWTMDGAVTSQFENHIRAIAGLELGDTSAKGYSAMVNCIGDEHQRQTAEAIPACHYYSYDKSPRIGRKLAHINIHDNDPSLVEKYLTQLLTN